MTINTIRTILVLIGLGIATPNARAQGVPPGTATPVQPQNMPPQTSAWNVRVGESFGFNKLNAQFNARIDSGAGWESLPTMRTTPSTGRYFSADGLLALDVNAHTHPHDEQHPSDVREDIVTPTAHADALAVFGPGTMEGDAYHVLGFGIPVNVHYTQEFGRLHSEETVTQLAAGGGGGFTFVRVSDARTRAEGAPPLTAWEPTIAANRLVLFGGAWSGAAVTAPTIRLDKTLFVTVPIVSARYAATASGLDMRIILRGLPWSSAFNYSDAEVAVRYQPFLMQPVQQPTRMFSPFVQFGLLVATARVPDIREQTHSAATLSFGVAIGSLTMAATPPRMGTGGLQ
ncbi:hypothetical protein HY480_02505 [Candidatus Uhrbacteria bacterium]|nr:hypothetical protein [Candidatus Uhrbacteria bacterium]